MMTVREARQDIIRAIYGEGYSWAARTAIKYNQQEFFAWAVIAVGQWYDGWDRTL
jgi:hypothetical protein